MYKINKHMVCINPDTEVLWKDKKFCAAIHLAQHEGVWSFGYHLEVSGCGVGCGGSVAAPAFGKYRHGYPDKATARAVAIKIALGFFIRKHNEDGHHCVGVIDRIKQELLGRQLELFV